MTSVLVTIDTELSPAAHKRGVSAHDNYNRAILGRVPDGEWGITFQIRQFNDHGLKATFFVEALSADVVGLDFLKRTVDPILSAGHEVQLHIHTEWLEWFSNDPVAGRRGQNMCNFSFADQHRLIQIGSDNLVRAGAPRPIAFRAGNYGANNDTLRALSRAEIQYDTSYNFPYLGNPCLIETQQPLGEPGMLDGAIEVPVSTFTDFPGHQRPAQLCAISSSEMTHLLRQCASQGRRTAVIVSHSFELLNSARTRSNPIVVRRFQNLCAALGGMGRRNQSSGFRNLDPATLAVQPTPTAPLHSMLWRTGLRVVEQAAGALLYG